MDHGYPSGGGGASRWLYSRGLVPTFCKRKSWKSPGYSVLFHKEATKPVCDENNPALLSLDIETISDMEEFVLDEIPL